MKESYRYTSRDCEECDDDIIQDVFKGECYCLHCGLITVETMMDGVPYV